MPTTNFGEDIYKPIEKLECRWDEATFTFSIHCIVLMTSTAFQEDVVAVFRDQKGKFDDLLPVTRSPPVIQLTPSFLRQFGDTATQRCSGESFVIASGDWIYKKPFFLVNL